MKVNSKVFVARFEPRSADMSKSHNTSSPRDVDTKFQVSGKGVLGVDKLLNENLPPSIVIGQHNGNYSPIVNKESKSRTFYPNKRDDNNHSTLDNGINGHIHDAHNGLHNGFKV